MRSRALGTAMWLVLLAGVAGGLSMSAPASAHRSGCHAAHSCPSDRHSYVWYQHGRGYDCASRGTGTYDRKRDTIAIRHEGRTYYCRRASDSRLWTFERLSASIPQEPFQLSIDGERSGRTKLVAIASRLGNTTRHPQVLVIAASGYLRIKAGADPDPPLPFGQSLVLGPAVFGASTSFPGTPRLFFNPQLQRVSIRHARDGSLRIRIDARDRDLAPQRTESNQIANLRWDLTLPRPTRRETRLDVHGSYTFTEDVVPDPTRTAEAQSFRLVQVSSMYIDPQRHDVDAFRYRTRNGLVGIDLHPGVAGTLLPLSPAPLAGRRVLDVVHTDDAGSPNGNTPSYRISFTTIQGPATGPLTPRAYFNGSQDLNDDNLGVWIHQQPSATIPHGTHGVIAYTVRATTDPLRRR